MPTPLFPIAAEPLMIVQGGTGNCYLLAILDCIYNLDEQTRSHVQSRFEAIMNGEEFESISFRVKQTGKRKPVQTKNIKEKYTYVHNKDTDEDIFTLSAERSRFIDTDSEVKSNSLAIKILERISAYYFDTAWGEGATAAVVYQESKEAHKAAFRFKDPSAEFVANLMGVVASDNLALTGAIKFKKINPAEPVYIELQYGKKDDKGTMHARHALRIDRIEERPDGNHLFILRNPWNNLATESFTLQELEARAPALSMFSPNPQQAELKKRLLQMDEEFGVYLYQHPALLPIVADITDNQTPDVVHNLILWCVRLHQKAPELFKQFQHLSKEDMAIVASALKYYGDDPGALIPHFNTHIPHINWSNLPGYTDTKPDVYERMYKKIIAVVPEEFHEDCNRVLVLMKETGVSVDDAITQVTQVGGSHELEGKVKALNTLKDMIKNDETFHRVRSLDLLITTLSNLTANSPEETAAKEAAIQAVQTMYNHTFQTLEQTINTLPEAMRQDIRTLFRHVSAAAIIGEITWGACGFSLRNNKQKNLETMLDEAPVLLNTRHEKSGHSLLMYAASGMDLNTIGLLIARGADLNIKSNVLPLRGYDVQQTALHLYMAAFRTRLKSLSVNQINQGVATLDLLANHPQRVHINKLERSLTLFREKIAETIQGKSMLEAAQPVDKAIVIAEPSTPVVPDARIPLATQLFEAIESTRDDIVQTLIEQKHVDVNHRLSGSAQVPEGSTPLIAAVIKFADIYGPECVRTSNIIKMLIQHGADPSLKNAEGKSAKDYFAEKFTYDRDAITRDIGELLGVRLIALDLRDASQLRAEAKAKAQAEAAEKARAQDAIMKARAELDRILAVNVEINARPIVEKPTQDNASLPVQPPHSAEHEMEPLLALVNDRRWDNKGQAFFSIFTKVPHHLARLRTTNEFPVMQRIAQEALNNPPFFGKRDPQIAHLYRCIVNAQTPAAAVRAFNSDQPGPGHNPN